MLSRAKTVKASVYHADVAAAAALVDHLHQANSADTLRSIC